MKKAILLLFTSVVCASSLSAQNFVYGLAGKSGGGNATVPGDAPIQPAQAFVDNIARSFYSVTGGFGSGSLDLLNLSNKGITYIGLDFFTGWLNASDSFGGSKQVDLSGNALTGANLDTLLSGPADPEVMIENGTLDISGGTNGTPTGGAANPTLWALANNGWYITFNLHSASVYVDGHAATPNAFTANFSSSAMSASEVNALLAFLVANYPSLGWTMTLTGSPAAPTGQGLTDKATLEGNGWTINTN